MVAARHDRAGAARHDDLVAVVAATRLVEDAPLEHRVGAAGLLRVEVLGHLAEDPVQHERAHPLVRHPRRQLVLRRVGDRLYERGRVDGGGIDLHR